jgi:predicted PurR-regulated permease PerM
LAKGVEPRFAGLGSSQWLVLALCVVAFVALTSLWVPLMLAAWVAILALPLQHRVARRLGGSHRAAGVLTVSFLLLVLVPLAALAVSLTSRAIDLGRDLLSSEDGAAALQALVSSSGNGPAKPVSLDALDVESLVAVAREHGASAWRAVSAVAGAATKAVIGIFVFVLGIYVFLIHGREGYTWFVERLPFSREVSDRLARAFSETGRGLVVGVGLTAVLQGIVATIGYVALGIREAFVLGALTILAAIIPAGGTGLVWAPVSAGLAIGGRPVAAAVMVAIGLVVSTADNFVRPLLTRYGKLRLPTFVLLVSMVGGLATFGPWGAVLGPLVVRLAMEGLEILRDQAKVGVEMPPHGEGALQNATTSVTDSASRNRVKVSSER